MNLLKELRKEAKKTEKVILGDDVKAEVEQFLLNAHVEDERILHNIGLDHNIEYERMLAQDYNRTKNANEIYDQQTFRGSEIKTLCNTYDLKLLRAQYFNGQIPSDLVRKLKEFEKRTGCILADSDNFFILAPTEQFRTIKQVPRAQDPILFYRTDESPNKNGYAREEDIFVQVHNWGNDFSFLRRFKDMFSTFQPYKEGPPNLNWFVGSTLAFLLLFSLLLLVGVLWPILVITSIYAYILYNLNHGLAYHEEWNTQNV